MALCHLAPGIHEQKQHTLQARGPPPNHPPGQGWGGRGCGFDAGLLSAITRTTGS